MVRLPKEYFRTQRHIQKAILRGDMQAAAKWLDMLERLIRIAERETNLYYPKRKQKQEAQSR